MQLSWNYNYGQFSNIFVESRYDSKMELLEHPEYVHQDGYTAFAAGLWFYMTPQDPKPSMHDVMTGFFVPNSTDLASNVKASFATTTNIINGGLECGRGFGYDKVVRRGQYFLKWLNFFGLPAEGDLDCGNQPNQFPAGGSSDVYMFFEKDWSGTGKCKLVQWMTQYSAAARDDYKRCVCDSWHADNPAGFCAAGLPDTSNLEEGTDNTNDDSAADVVYEYGNVCSTNTDQDCALTPGCTKCSWSWPNDDPATWGSDDAKCRCESTEDQSNPEFPALTATVDGEDTTLYVQYPDWADAQTSGSEVTFDYNNRMYLSTQPTLDTSKYFMPNMLGGSLEWDVDLSEVGCGCLTALYAIGMPAVDNGSDPFQYCDAA